MVLRRNRRATHGLIFIFIFSSEPSHVLISNFTLLRLVEFPLTIYRFIISNRGTGNTFIDLLSVLVSVSLFRKQCILERIALDIECFKPCFATRRISTGILKSWRVLQFAIMLVILFLHTIWWWKEWMFNVPTAYIKPLTCRIMNIGKCRIWMAWVRRHSRSVGFIEDKASSGSGVRTQEPFWATIALRFDYVWNKRHWTSPLF